MTKKLHDYTDMNGMLIQTSEKRENYIDSNFLTTNTIAQKAYMDDSEYTQYIPIPYIIPKARMAYMDDSGLLRRYWRNFDSLPGANPEETKRYTNPNHVSRDNSIGMIIMLGKFDYKADVKQFCLDTIKRGSFYQNTHTVQGKRKLLPDFAGPGSYAVMFRAMFDRATLGWMFPLLFTLDFFIFLNVLFHVLQSKKDPTHTSTVYHMVSTLMQARDTVATPFSELATYLLLNNRAKVPGFDHEEPVVSAMKYYSRSKYDPPLDKVVEDSVRWLRR